LGTPYGPYRPGTPVIRHTTGVFTADAMLIAEVSLVIKRSHAPIRAAYSLRVVRPVGGQNPPARRCK